MAVLYSKLNKPELQYHLQSSIAVKRRNSHNRKKNVSIARSAKNKKEKTLNITNNEPLPFTVEMLTEKRPSKNKFSVVSAVYNVSRYLNAYFESLINQTINFQDHIELILIDDGSTDSSASVIREWASRYPGNIRYLCQENAGQGAARNFGLKYARHDWVTFIDPDDFVSLDYFEKADEGITAANSQGKPLKLVSSNYIFYNEDRREYSDTHPLRFRFAKGDCILPVLSPGKHIQLSVNSVLFKRAILLEQGLAFNPKVKPAFEDSLFVNSYLLQLSDGFMAFLSSSKYFYRKRSDGSSTLDTGWQHPGRYSDQLSLGSLSLIDESIERHGHVKEFIQRVVLYDLSWHFKKIINNESRLSHLPEASIAKYRDLLVKIMESVSVETIISFELAGIWFYQKVGLLSFFKKTNPDFTIVYIEAFDELKDLVKLKYFSAEPDCCERYMWDGNLSLPVFSTVRQHTLFNESFVYERIVWLRIGEREHLDVSIPGFNHTRISLKGKQHRKGVLTSDIKNSFRKYCIEEQDLPSDIIELRKAARLPETIIKYGNCWLLMDRDTQADDNAEHLYRYLDENKPDIRKFFLLNETSTDWPRLIKEGFQLIAFGSTEHKLALLNASHLISSHADRYIFGGIEKNHFGDLLRYRYTFLQHGVTKDDISNWLNTKEIDCLITTTNPEFKSIAESGTYKFTTKEVALTGFARHDRLRNVSRSPEKTILIMPTWRNNLIGPATANGNEREINPDFKNTQYCQAWRAVLRSELLNYAATSLGYKIVFFPHANIQPYLSQFNVPPHIEIKSHQAGESIQSLFRESEIMLTDYSSVAFEMAALERPVIYYQFDSDEVFNGGHIYRPGYFDYKLDGFGPVCSSLEQVIDSLKELIESNGQPRLHYLQRMRDTFAFNDRNNCQRIYEAIDALDHNIISKSSTKNAFAEYARRVTARQDWELTIFAWNKILNTYPDISAEAYLNLAIANRNLKRPEEASAFLNSAKNSGCDPLAIAREELVLALETFDLEKANEAAIVLSAAKGSSPLDDRFIALLARSYRLQHNPLAAMEQIELASDPKHPDIVYEKAEMATHTHLWQDARALWAEVISINHNDFSLIRHSEACRNLGLFDESQNSLSCVMQKDNAIFQIESGELYFAQANWKAAAKAWSSAENSQELSPDTYLKLSRSRRNSGDPQGAKAAFSKADKATDERTLLQEKALIHTALGDWLAAEASWEDFLARRDLRPNRDAWLHLAQVKYSTGKIPEAKNALEKFEKLCGPNKRSLALRDEICFFLKIKSPDEIKWPEKATTEHSTTGS